MATLFRLDWDEVASVTSAELEAELAQDAFLRLSHRMQVEGGQVSPIPDWNGPKVSMLQVMEHAYMIQFLAMSAQLKELLQLFEFFLTRCDEEVFQVFPSTMVQLLGVIAAGNLPALQNPNQHTRDYVLSVCATANRLRAYCRLETRHTVSDDFEEPKGAAEDLSPEAAFKELLQSQARVQDPTRLAEVLMRLHQIFKTPDQRKQITEQNWVAIHTALVSLLSTSSSHFVFVETLLLLDELYSSSIQYLDDSFATICATLAKVMADAKQSMEQHVSEGGFDMTREVVYFGLKIILRRLEQPSKVPEALLNCASDVVTQAADNTTDLVISKQTCAACGTKYVHGRYRCECCPLCLRKDKCVCDTTADPLGTRRLIHAVRSLLYYHQNLSTQTSNASCASCGKPASLRCSRCQQEYYCNVTCQRSRWRNHKAFCKST